MDPIRITIETNAEDAAKTFETLSNAFQDADNSAVDLRKEIKALKSEIYKMTPGTEEYAKALVQLGDKMNTLGDIQRDLKASTGGLDTVFQTSTTAISSFASGISAAAGIVALFGGENENLQKTFVKLQAVMSIATGLKGFAGIKKYTDSAIASIAAFVTKMRVSRAAVEEDTAAKVKNIAATKAMETESAKAAAGMTLVGSATQNASKNTEDLTKVIKALLTKFGAVLTAIYLFIKGIQLYVRSQQEAEDAEKSYQRAISDTVSELDTVTDAEERRRIENEKYIEYLKLIGAAEEKVNSARMEYLETEIALKSAQLEHNKAIEDSITWYNSTSVLIKNGLKSRRQLRKTIKEEGDAVSALRIEYAKLQQQQQMRMLDSGIDKISNEFEIKMAEGIATMKDKYEAMIAERQRQIDDLWANAPGRGRSPRALSEEQRALKAEWEKDIERWQHDIEVYNAGLRKTARDQVRKNIEDYQQNFDSMKKTILESLQELVDDANKDITRISETDVQGISVVSNVFTKLHEYMQMGLNDEFIAKLRKDIADAKITEKQRKELNDLLDNLADNYKTMVKDFAVKIVQDQGFTLPSGNEMDLTNIEAILKPFDKSIDNAVEFVFNFRKRIEGIETAFKNGEITPAEYTDALLRNVNDYTSQVAREMAKIPQMVEQKMREIPGVEDMDTEQVNALRDLLTEYLKRSFYVPESEINGIVETARNTVDKTLKQALDVIESTYNRSKLEYETVLAEKQYELSRTLFGATEGQTHAINMQYFTDMKSALDVMYRDMIAEYDKLIEQYKNDAVMYQYYVDMKTQAQLEYRQKSAEINKNIVDEEKESFQRRMQNYQALANSFSSMGSAFEEYYTYMAEHEAKNEQESRKYTIKSLRAKQFEAIANVAAGIVGAISSAMSSLPAPYNAVVAAIESAAVAASGAVQIATIQKQIKALGGTSSNDSPQVAGMVDRIITANAQNSDQTAQLNAQYGSNGDQRVYVTQSDLDEGRNTRRTAVTQNSF